MPNGWEVLKAHSIRLEREAEALREENARLTRERDEAVIHPGQYGRDVEREDECCDCHDAAREEIGRLKMDFDRLHDERFAEARKADTLRQIVKGAHGALTDAGSVVVPGTLEGDLAPAIRALTRELDEARAEAEKWRETLSFAEGCIPAQIMLALRLSGMPENRATVGEIAAWLRAALRGDR